ncbi:hypothetical protein D3C71_1600510 [compost metagenome]
MRMDTHSPDLFDGLCWQRYPFQGLTHGKQQGGVGGCALLFRAMEVGHRCKRGLRQAVAEQQADGGFRRAFGLLRSEVQRHHHQQRLIVDALVDPVIHRRQPTALDRCCRLPDTRQAPRLLPHTPQHTLWQPAFDLQRQRQWFAVRQLRQNRGEVTQHLLQHP